MCGLNIKCIPRGDVFPPTVGGTVWERCVPPDVNKWSNRTEELSSLFLPYIHYNLVPVTWIAFWWSNGDWWNKNFLSVTHGYDAARDWGSDGVWS